jgi:hypothetical protein
MNDNRITGQIRPSQVTVTHEFNCGVTGCDVKEVVTHYGETFYEDWPKGWKCLQIGTLGAIMCGDWICPAHEITVDGKALE